LIGLLNFILFGKVFGIIAYWLATYKFLFHTYFLAIFSTLDTKQ